MKKYRIIDCLLQGRRPYLMIGRRNVDGGDTLQIVTD